MSLSPISTSPTTRRRPRIRRHSSSRPAAYKQASSPASLQARQIPQLYGDHGKQRHLRPNNSNGRFCLAGTKRNKDTILDYHREASNLVIKRTLDTVYQNLHRPPTLLLSSPTSSSPDPSD